MVPELGMGAMDTPTTPEGAATLNSALDSGIEFFDTARGYEGSEHLLGQVLRERPDATVHMASKTFNRTASGAQYEIDRSLSVLGVPRITLYQLHDLRTEEDWDLVMREDGALAGLQTAQYRGLIGHIGVSSHNLDLVERAIRSDLFDAVMLEYSAFYPETAPLIELAAEHDIGVIVMRPVGGSGRTSTMRGKLAAGYDGPLTPANLLRYVLSNPGISVAIPGARYPDRVYQNAQTAGDYTPMSAAERSELEREAAQLYE
jgi:predicted aldo/keto reductase-like oxidoreductase